MRLVAARLFFARRLRCVEFAILFFDAASALVAGNDGADVVRASSLACSGDFLLCPAGCQCQNPIAEARQLVRVASWFCGSSAAPPA